MKNSLNFFITALLFIVFSTTAVYAQPANDNCSTATAIGILPIPTACGTGIGVNTGATITLNNQTTAGATAANPYVYLTSCSGGGSTQVPGLDTWYSFVASGSVVNITVSDFPNASLGLWAGSNCTTLRGAGCTIIPNSGTGTLTVSSIEIGKTYYIQISGNSSTATDSNFSIAINNSIDCDDCLRVSTLTPSPLPVSGIYSPGQVVRFCYTISQWKATNGNWLHGVQIKMGAGWTGTISNTTPATSYVTGNWVFRPTVLVANGTNWDPGFYFNDGTNNWGDYRSIPQNWTFCFDLTVGSSCTSGDDLSVIINTSGDGESGSYPNPGCQQDPQNFLTNVKSQGPIMTSAIAATVCSGTTNFPLTSNVPATYNWIATDNPNVTGESLISQNSNAISDNLVNISNVSQVVTYSVTATSTATGCVGVPQIISITVKPSPVAITPTSFSVCPGAIVPVANFVSLPVGGTFIWTNNTPSIGLAASGTNFVPSFVAVNATSFPITATISVISTLNGCVGNAVNYTITINPNPTVSVPSPLIYCNNEPVPSIVLVSTLLGATYSWSIDDTSIGLPAGGTGNIPGFTAINSSLNPVTATISVVPTLNGCSGSTNAFTITVKPTPTVTVPSNDIYCVNATVPATAFVSSPTLGTFTWTNNNSNIGLTTNGTGDIASFVTTNSTANAITSTIIVTPTVNGCLGTSSNYTITVDAIPTVTTPTSAAYCNGATVPAATFTSATTGATFDWTNDDNTIGLASSGTGNIPAFTAVNTTIFPIIATITVTPTTANGCVGTPFDYTITVNPTPTVAVPANDIYCNNTLVPATLFANTPAGGTFAWTNDNINIGLAASGAGDIASFTATNITNAPIIANISVTPTVNGCVGTASSYSITVDPSPTVSVPTSVIYCNADSVLVTNFVSLPAGGTFAWTNDNTNIGLTASGTGDISSFLATNTTPNQITANITVTATVNGCSGIPNTYTVKVDPTPTVATPTSAPYCNNALVPTAIFTSATTGATFTWTNDNSNIGLAANGTGNIVAFTATNTTNAPILATITVTPFTVNGCAGTPSSYSITVNPTPTVTVPANNIYCVNATVPATAFVSSPTLGTFTWTNNNVNIGLLPNGTGDIASFVATNSTANAITSTIIVTPTVNGCLGTSSSYSITVDAIPTVTTPTNAAYCNGAIVPAATFASLPTGGTFTWTNSNSTVGLLLTSGVGNIPSFVATNATNSPITTLITVIPTVNGCTGTPSDYIITVNPSLTFTPPGNAIYCNNGVVPTTTFSSSATGVIYNWTNDTPSIGIGLNGTGSIPSFLALNTTLIPITATITVTPLFNGCIGIQSTFTITVNPTPAVTVPINNSYCTTSSVPATAFVGTLPGTTFSWTNSNTNIGLSASAGSGNIGAFIATNTSANPIIAVISVTATANGCSGTPNTYTITVNPTPTVTAVAASNSICTSSTTGIALTGTPIIGTTFAWTAVASAGVTGASSGTGILISQALINLGTTIGNVVYTITPTANNCPGTPINISIDVTPRPTISATPLSQNICSGNAPNINLLSDVLITNFNWTVIPNNVTGASAGSGNLISQPLTAIGLTAGQAIYTVTPNVNGCTGNPIIVTVVVSPIPVVIALPLLGDTICSGQRTNVTLTGGNPGTTFSWNSIPIGVSGATSGTTSIIAQTLTTTSAVQGNVIYTITPSLNGCLGLPLPYPIVVNPTPQFLNIPPQLPICSGDTTSINLVPSISIPLGTTYDWTVIENGVSGATDGNGILINQTLDATGTSAGTATYNVIPTLGTCSGNSINIIANVNPLPIPDLTDGVICVSASGSLLNPYLITTGIPNSNHSHVWYLNNAPIIPSAVGNNYLATIIGDYSVTIIANATGCIASQTLATATVTAKSPGLTLTAFASNEFSENAIITANVNGGTGVFEYSLDNGPFQLSNIFTEVLPGNHIVTVRDTSGCTDLSTNVVVMGYQLFFTPNGDTYNDYWNIIGLKDQPNAKIYIFDRYGKLITQINTKTNGWDGKVNGSDLPASDYWFSVEYLDLTTLETKIFKSHFSLKR
ncbi:Gliding motility-associated, C-terminal domain [Flavobacteriaceae bacterium]